MKIILPKAIAFVIAVLFVFIANAQNIKGVIEELPSKDKYEYIKKNSIGGNLSVFKQYEEQKTNKVIFICVPNFISFRVLAFWELDDVHNKKEAEKYAASYCSQSSSRYVLLGYAVLTEQKF